MNCSLMVQFGSLHICQTGERLHERDSGAGRKRLAFGLTKHTHDLGFGETGFLHQSLLIQIAEKVLLEHSLN